MADPWANFEVTTPRTAPPKNDPWASFEVVRAPSAKSAPPAEPAASWFTNLDRVLSLFNPAGPVVEAAHAIGGDTGRQIKGARHAAFQGGTFSLGDEIAGAIPAALTDAISATTGRGPTPGEVYTDITQDERARLAAFHKSDPVASTLGNISGVVGTLPALPAWMMGGAKTLPGMMARGGAGGAVLGGAAGFGQGEGDIANRLKSGAIGAAIGGGTGVALPPLISGAGWAAKNAGGRWLQENVGSPLLNKLADITDYLTPKTKPGSLSAAAPDGGPGVPMSGMMDRITETLRGKAGTMANPAETDALKTVARSMAAGGRTTEDIARELTLMGPDATLANASPIPTQNLLRTAYMSPGSAMQKIKDALDAQARGTGPRVVRAFEGNQPPPTIYDATRYLAANKSQVGADAYAPAWEAAKGWAGGMGPMTEDIQRLMQNPAIKEAFDQVTADAAKYGRDLSPLEIAHLVKRQLNASADAAYASGRAVNKDMVGRLADDWEKALWEANPKLADADRAYAQAAGLQDWLDRGRQFMRTGVNEVADSVSPAALAAEFPTATEAEKMLFRVGSTNTVRDAALAGDAPARRLATNIDKSDPLREKLTTIYGPDQGQSIIRQAGTEKAFGEMKNRVMAGSHTAAALADMADQGVPSILRSGGSLASRAWDATMDAARKLANNNEAVRDAYTRVLLETNPTQNLKNLEILDALIKAQLEGSAGRAGAAAVTGGQGGDMLRVKR